VGFPTRRKTSITIALRHRVGGCSTDANRRSLVNPGPFYTKYNNTSAVRPGGAVFGEYCLRESTACNRLRPFNRGRILHRHTDVRNARAPNTGVLVKAVVAHDRDRDRTHADAAPVARLRCRMQVVYFLDTDTNPLTTPHSVGRHFVGMTAADIRAHLWRSALHFGGMKGQRDDSYTYKNVLDSTHANEDTGGS